MKTKIGLLVLLLVICGTLVYGFSNGDVASKALFVNKTTTECPLTGTDCPLTNKECPMTSGNTVTKSSLTGTTDKKECSTSTSSNCPSSHGCCKDKAK